MASDTVREQALGWAVRTGDPGFADWDGFMVWLEADPAHARAYDEVGAAVAEGAEAIARHAPANDDVVHRDGARRRPWLAGGIAAILAVVAGTWVLSGERRDLYTMETRMGETRVVTLDRGTQVALAGGTALAFDRKDKRFARLDHGQALFTVRHDAAHPFEVAVGDERLVDIGTIFDVRHDGRELVVAVSEGAVQFDPGDANVRVSAGEVLRRAEGSGQYSLSRVAIEQVGEWHEGRLTFEAASLAEVAMRLKRATGIDYVADGAGTVSGSILIDPLRKDPAAIGPLLGVPVRSWGQRWMIGAR
ncbi:FecR domain-containing protein [Novosphingobium sp. 9U]|uniref:FecR family protein n=1 Tax=Novosphingobium sp. 9U TaxID=2653158 RepID=UPI0012EFED32|nr:FecR domain-containing protein [Novosphingobium sp. 9U]VWX48843.1 Iron dicitrate transport regulator FecR [Novosphingobium sp. 9U]